MFLMLNRCAMPVLFRIALFSLDEFEAAKTAFEDVQRLDPNNAQCKKWIRKCEAELNGK